MKDKQIQEFRDELISIANWWRDHTVDLKHGGFIGELGLDNKIKPGADKSVILNARILWFFSEAAQFLQDDDYAYLAKRAYEYLMQYFVDKDHGGVYWALTAEGKVANDLKQTFAQAYAIYGLSAYYRLSKNSEALEMALSIFALIEEHLTDKRHRGYIDACNVNWQPLEDYRRADDPVPPKSLGAHLHVLEAYTNLYALTRNAWVGKSMKQCLDCFDRHILDKKNGHLRLTFSFTWEDLSTGFSYGHDIEASWLIWQALLALGDKTLMQKYKASVVKMATVCLQESLGEKREMFDVYDVKEKSFLKERVWWVQAEALVGYLHAWKMTREEKFLKAAFDVWGFIKRFQVDQKNGEWHMFSLLDHSAPEAYKMGFWKGPYHNGRAMMEACKILAS